MLERPQFHIETVDSGLNYGRYKAEPVEPGYGVTVVFHLKINRGTVRTFYGAMKSTHLKGRANKEKQLELVRTAILETLTNFASTLKSLDSRERIALCAHIEDRNEIDTSNNRSIIVFSVEKNDVELLATEKIGLDDFKKRVQQLEY